MRRSIRSVRLPLALAIGALVIASASRPAGAAEKARDGSKRARDQQEQEQEGEDASDARDELGPEPPTVKASIGLQFSTGTLPLSLGGATFSGHGYDPTATRHDLSAKGSELGIRRPSLRVYDFGLGIGYDTIFAGIVVGFGKTGADSVPGNPGLASEFQPQNLTMIRVGAEIGANVWLGPQVRLSLTTLLGFESVSMSFTNLQRLCKDDRKKNCDGGSANTLIGWVQPRLAFEVMLGKGIPIGFGAYVADNVVMPSSIETGFTVSLRAAGDIPTTEQKPR